MQRHFAEKTKSGEGKKGQGNKTKDRARQTGAEQNSADLGKGLANTECIGQDITMQGITGR